MEVYTAEVRACAVVVERAHDEVMLILARPY